MMDSRPEPMPTDAQLVGCAVDYAVSGQIRPWRRVAQIFGVSEAIARALCARFGFDPDGTG